MAGFGFGGGGYGTSGFGFGPYGGGEFGRVTVKLTELFATGSLLANFSAWTISEAGPAPTTTPGPYRPPNWGVRPQQTLMTVTLPNAQPPTPGQPSSTNYYFDSVLRVTHRQELIATRHPVQTGATISDHAFLTPSMVELEIKMSDTMQSFVNGQYSGNASKSVSAYQTFRLIQGLRVPIILTTRLYTYTNMLISSLEAPDNVDTQFGLRCFIRFQQIIPAQIAIATYDARSLEQKILQLPDSTREHDTAISNLGQKTGESVLPPIENSHRDMTPTSIPGASPWSSNPLAFGPEDPSQVVP